jgi:hypothetical protein
MNGMTNLQKLFAIVLTGFVFTAGAFAQTPVTLLDGKLTFVLPANFKKMSATGPVLASYGATDGGEWIQISLAGQPLSAGGLEAWMERKKASYTKGMPPEIRPHLRWLDHKVVTRDGVKWADLRFDCVPDGPDGSKRAILYTRFFATTLNGKLLELALCSNLTADAKRKAALDRIVDSIKFVPVN